MRAAHNESGRGGQRGRVGLVLGGATEGARSRRDASVGEQLER